MDCVVAHARQSGVNCEVLEGKLEESTADTTMYDTVLASDKSWSTRCENTLVQVGVGGG